MSRSSGDMCFARVEEEAAAVAQTTERVVKPTQAQEGRTQGPS